MNPTFRQIIYDLPLCLENNIEITSSFLDNDNNNNNDKNNYNANADDNNINNKNKKKNQKYEILLAIQKLFIRLQYSNTHSISTFNLTEAFKWEGGEGSNQQDSQEFIRLFLYEILERILMGTPYDGYINNLFKLIAMNYMKCGNCEAIKSREEVYLDITLPVMGYKGMKESLNELFNNEEIISNYKCDACEQKVDLKRFSKLKQLPIFINFPLNRFSFDLETFERIKLNDKFEFPLEIDMREYLSQEILNDLEFESSINRDEEFVYELYGIIVHRGTPYSGHYFSYIRDICDEGNWNLDEIKEYKKEPEVFDKDKEKEKDKNEEEQKEKDKEKETETDKEKEINASNKNNNKKNQGKKNNNNSNNNKKNQGKNNNSNNNKKSKVKKKNKNMNINKSINININININVNIFLKFY
jgi:hypothetical protein